MSDTNDASPAAESGTADPVDTLDMSDNALRLDGNAAAGMLFEIFLHEMTNAQSTCAQCGAPPHWAV